MGDDATPVDPAANKPGSTIQNILKFLNDPTFGKGVKDIQAAFKDQGLSQAEKEKLVKDLEERDKTRQAELDGLRKKLDENQAAIKNDQDLIQKSREASAKIQKEIDEIAARRKTAKDAIAKSLADAGAAHDEAARLEAELKKLQGGN